MQSKTRRRFLSDVGQGMLVAGVGYGTALDLGLTAAWAEEDAADELQFGPREPLVGLMQDTPADKLLPVLVKKLKQGTDLRELVAAGALANARTFGGEDYVGFHTMMALAPAYHMAKELPAAQQALPVLKVLYRNSDRIQAFGGRKAEVLHTVKPGTLSSGTPDGRVLLQQVRKKEVDAAEATFAEMSQGSIEDAFNELLVAVQDKSEVHRIVMPYRAWELIGFVGKKHAHTMLRQSVRYCVKNESAKYDDYSKGGRDLLPKLLEEHKLLFKPLGKRLVDDAWIERMSRTIFGSSPEQAAEAAAAALAEGIAPDAVGEAMSLASTQLVLRDVGRTEKQASPGKPAGSIHGAGIGVHACDSANAWRNIAKVSNTRNTIASLILGSHQVAFDRTSRGGEFLKWEPYPLADHREKIKATTPEGILKEAEAAIQAGDQGTATAAIARYAELDCPHRPVIDLLLRYGVSEDGALHAEKYYRTVTEEFASTRPAFRWEHLKALARVTASEHGWPAPGCDQARDLLRA